MTTPIILVTGAGGPAGINALKLLSRLPDVTTVGVDVDPLSAGRAFTSHFETVAKVSDPAAYAADMKRVIAAHGVTCVLPTVAEELVIIREALKDIPVELILSPQETLERCHDKRRLYEHVANTFPEAMTRHETADQSTGFAADQYFIKPSTGRGGRGCRVVSKAEREALRQDPHADEWIVMDILPGMEWTVDAYVAADGRPIFIVPRERLQLSGGICSKGRPVHHPEVIARTQKLLSFLPCRGPVCVQWKANAAGVPLLVEVNPRLSGAVTITAMNGANPMQLLVQELRGEPLVEPVWTEHTIVRYFEEYSL